MPTVYALGMCVIFITKKRENVLILPLPVITPPSAGRSPGPVVGTTIARKIFFVRSFFPNASPTPRTRFGRKTKGGGNRTGAPMKAGVTSARPGYGPHLAHLEWISTPKIRPLRAPIPGFFGPRGNNSRKNGNNSGYPGHFSVGKREAIISSIWMAKNEWMQGFACPEGLPRFQGPWYLPHDCPRNRANLSKQSLN